MKDKHFLYTIFLLSGVLLSSIYYNYFYNDVYIKSIEYRNSVIDSLSAEKYYLNKSMEYQSVLSEIHLQVDTKDSILVYFPTGACSSCAEDLLLLIHENYKISNEVSILASDSASLEFVEQLNDVFQLSYDTILRKINPINDASDLVVFKYKNNDILSPIKYFIGDDQYLKYYFSKFHLNNK